MIYAFLCDDEPFYSESVPHLKHWGILSEICLMIPETGIMLFMYYNLSPTDHYYMKRMLQKSHERCCDERAKSRNRL